MDPSESEAVKSPKDTSDVTLPMGFYTFQPRLVRSRYLTYANATRTRAASVTAQGTQPTNPECRWELWEPLSRSLIRTMIFPAATPFVKLQGEEIVTTDALDPYCYFKVEQTGSPPDMNFRFQSDLDQSKYIGVTESGAVVVSTPSTPNRTEFTATSVISLSSSKKDFDRKTCQIVSKMNGKALSVQSNGKVSLVNPKSHDKTTHVTALKRGADTDAAIYRFQSVSSPKLYLKGLTDNSLIALQKPSSFAILETPESATAYGIYSVVHRKYICVKNEHEVELNPNPLPPQGVEPLTNGPGFFEINEVN